MAPSGGPSVIETDEHEKAGPQGPAFLLGLDLEAVDAGLRDIT